MLELKDIQKSYKVGEEQQLVLKGIDVKFRKNEFTSILGSSGSGKTTLLNIIGGLDKYDSGDLIIDGISTSQYKDRDWDSYRNYRVGFIFQSYNLIMHQTILSNVEIALTLSGVSKQDRKAKAIEALTRVGLKDHINKKPNQLSGGQMQRVAIARALVNDPEIILADEPTGALDSATSVQIMDLLKEIAGDKLVIMVTHNPELAEKYSSRIIELKDGKIINDSDPFDGDEEVVKGESRKKTSMSLGTSLALSFNNLLTKKGRTFLTAFAGSIGIIGIALILSLSNGINKYAKNLERNSMSDFPITIEKKSFDLFGSLASAFDLAAQNKQYDKNTLYSDDDVVKSMVVDTKQGMLQTNDLVHFKEYVDGNEEFKKCADKIIYDYDLDLQVYGTDYTKANPVALPGGTEKNIFTEFDAAGKDITVLAGRLPENENELVLSVGHNNTVSDSVLYALGLKDREEMVKDVEKIMSDNSYKVPVTTYTFDDILNRSYKLILNTDYYSVFNGQATDHTNDASYMKGVVDSARDITIVGVVSKPDATESFIGYSHDLKLSVIRSINESDIFKAQIADKETNILTGEKFDGITSSYDDVSHKLGLYEESDPTSISIYPKDYESKEKMASMIKQYNDDKKASGLNDQVINYSDTMKNIVGGATKIVDGISYVLIAFVAISLIVSSIMIAIITYISVLERTKEIGILRAIGASKKDIRRVFRAETIIEGLIAGVLGVGLALLLSLLVNVIVAAFWEIEGIATMPVVGAIILILLSIGLNVLAGSKPARMASKKDPVEALRTE